MITDKQKNVFRDILIQVWICDFDFKNHFIWFWFEIIRKQYNFDVDFKSFSGIIWIFDIQIGLQNTFSLSYFCPNFTDLHCQCLSNQDMDSTQHDDINFFSIKFYGQKKRQR